VNDLEASHISDLLGAIGVEHPPELVQVFSRMPRRRKTPPCP